MNKYNDDDADGNHADCVCTMMSFMAFVVISLMDARARSLIKDPGLGI